MLGLELCTYFAAKAKKIAVRSGPFGRKKVFQSDEDDEVENEPEVRDRKLFQKNTTGTR